MNPRLGLYTTLYPEVLRFFDAWCESVRQQTDADFDIWIGSDQVERPRAIDALGAGRSVYYQEAPREARQQK